MKKSLLLVVLISTCLITGCTKNYKTVQEYADAMTEIRNQAGNYTVEAVIATEDANSYVKSYIKDNKWKTEISKNDGNTYQEGILYDGDEVYSYSKKEKLAMSIPFKQIIKKQAKQMPDGKTTDFVMRYINPTGIIYHWSFDAKNLDDGFKFGEKNAKKNDFKCRMIMSKTDNGEMCISDKYGIAVYAKINDPQKGKTIEFNVKKVNNTPLSDADVNLPEGVQKISMADLFQKMANMMR